MQAKSGTKLCPQNRGCLNTLYRATTYSALSCVGYSGGIFSPLSSKFFCFGDTSVMMVVHQCRWALLQFWKKPAIPGYDYAVGQDFPDAGKLRNGTKAMGNLGFAAIVLLRRN